jgi:hypothetical protein
MNFIIDPEENSLIWVDWDNLQGSDGFQLCLCNQRVKNQRHTCSWAIRPFHWSIGWLAPCQSQEFVISVSLTNLQVRILARQKIKGRGGYRLQKLTTASSILARQQVNVSDLSQHVDCENDWTGERIGFSRCHDDV